MNDRTQQEVAALFRQYGPPIYRRALRLLNDPAEAEEAMQEIFIKALKHFDDLDDRRLILNWLYRITTNHCLNQIRGRRRRAAAYSTFATERAGDMKSAPVSMTAMRQLLSQAEPKQAQAAVFVHIDGMSYSEAATRLGVSKRTVGNLVQRFGAWAAGQLEATA